MSHSNQMKSSEVMVRALGFEPEGAKATEPGTCAMCGTDIQKDDLCAPLRLGPGFMDDLYMAARGSQVICGWCAVCLSVEGLRATGYGAFSLQGFQPFRKWNDIAAALADPPEPPFVLVQATANNQHMAWRAPVSWSRELFYVRVGLRDVKIRRSVLLDSLASCVLLGEAANVLATTKRKTETKMLPHPFIGLSRDLKENAVEKHGRIKPTAYDAVAKDPFLQPHLDRIVGMTMGETWAMLFLLVHGAGFLTNKN